MAEKYFCDGDCAREICGSVTDVMVRRPGSRIWYRHKLCDECATKNLFVIDTNGRYVSDSGFASDVLR